MNGMQLKTIRERRDWSQERMAAEIGVSRVLLGQMERGLAPIEPRTEHLINMTREFMVDLRQLEPDARSSMSELKRLYDKQVPGGSAEELVGLRIIESGEIMGICRIKVEISGDDEEKRRQIETIFQAYVPDAKCEIWDYHHKYRCGVVIDQTKIEVSFVRRGVTEEDARVQAEFLAKKVAALR